MKNDANWRTSSYSGTENCVEFSDNYPDQVRVRDTKDRGRGILDFSPESWSEFVGYSRREAI
ncbi:DUF397 domain-containing protein [Streptomyces zingiberis]|uniref:DUF397 domain-containing protein n=1 Tax=Streptomyces zingiberis TaxID=2053010 RepID=A0ABX1BSX0_9ACTN|nr:DUF397 domain-containing protein [Streptomyces zingiberis]NJP99297.1 DUF397 domain-containing protein [Streptomyces zingiberis]